MKNSFHILVLGASYGLLPGVKLALAGHKVTFVGRHEEVVLMGRNKIGIQMRHRRTGEELHVAVAIAADADCGIVALRTPSEADPAHAAIVIFAMQEGHYADPAVARLVDQIALLDLPILSIMNISPPPFLSRLGITQSEALAGVYSSEDIWRKIRPEKLTHTSPDPQAVRLDASSPGDLTVTHPSNFKAAPFAHRDDQDL